MNSKIASGPSRAQPVTQQPNLKQTSVSNSRAVENIYFTDTASTMNGTLVVPSEVSVSVVGAASTSSSAGSITSAKTSVKTTKTPEPCDISEAEEESDEEPSSDEESENEENSMVLSGMEQMKFNGTKKGVQQHQAPITTLSDANYENIFQNHLGNGINVTETRNENVNDEATDNKNSTSDHKRRSLVGSGQRFTGSEIYQRSQSATTELPTQPLVIKPADSDVGTTSKVSRRAAQINKDLADWQRAPYRANNRCRSASAGNLWEKCRSFG